MKQTTFILIFFLSLLSCNPGPSNNTNQDIKVQTLKELEQSDVNDTNNLLQGIWAENEEDNAFVVIKNDTMFDIERLEPRTFSLNGDTMIIDNDTSVKWIILKLTTDSLWMTNSYLDYTIKLYNRK